MERMSVKKSHEVARMGRVVAGVTRQCGVAQV